jgi:hypothetical protein
MQNKPNSEKSMANRTTQKDKWRTELQKMMSMPFVRIDLQLEMDQDDITEAIAEWQSSRTGIMNYEEYLPYEDESKSQVSFVVTMGLSLSQKFLVSFAQPQGSIT